MNFARNSKSVLLHSCGGAALALGVMAMPVAANAQAFQATPSVVQGSAVIDRNTPGVDTVTVVGLDAVIDWTPDEDINGDALTFLPAGNTGIFQSQPGDPIFGVINRILPATNGNVAVMDGAVVSQLQQLSGPPVPGGFVMFYSPTGLIIGSNATFDIGGLVLTSIAPDIASFSQFVTGGGSISFTGVPNDSTAVQIDPGATITGSGEGSAFAVVAPQILMSGTADINGSTAYVGAQEVFLSYADGLFDIIISTGSNVATPIFHDGTTTGPASTGAADNHVIYAVMQAQANPVSALFTGDLGYAPAVSATIDNGDVVLVANYDVQGRDVAGGTIGSDTFFDGRNETSDVQADINIGGQLFPTNITSSITAVGTHDTQMISEFAGTLDVTGDVTLVGRSSAVIFTGVGGDISIDGDVLVSARDFADVVGTVGVPGELDAFGGSATLSAASGGSIVITGNAEVNARATSGVATVDLVGGTGQGGSATATAQDNGTLDVGGNLSVLADASPFQLIGLNVAGDQTGGTASIAAFNGGTVLVGGTARAEAQGFGLNASGSAVTQVSTATGGTAEIFADALNAPSAIAITQDVFLDAGGFAGSDGPTGGAAGDGLGGNAVLSPANGGEVQVGGNVSIAASGVAATHANGIGGIGAGGAAFAEVTGDGLLTVGGTFDSTANGFGGNGQTGGAGYGGLSEIQVDLGTVTINGVSGIRAIGLGGDASFGFGGDGGFAQGGNANVQARGTLTGDAVINVGANLTLSSVAIAGEGGAGDGSTILPGAGGDAEGGVAATDLFRFPGVGGGAYAFANGDRGTLDIAGDLIMSSTALGGSGGLAGPGQLGGAGGNATSGDAVAAIIPGAGDGSVALGTLSAANTSISNDAVAGNGGFDDSGTTRTGIGGNATAGRALVQAQFGTLTFGATTLSSSAFGGAGSTGGNATGGLRAGVSILNSDSGTIVLGSLQATADGRGGSGTDGNGGDATGGAAFVGFQGGAITILGTTNLDASGVGGFATNGNGGTGTGGLVDLADFTGTPGSGDFQGLAQLIASGVGGAALSSGFDGGDGFGGNAFLLSQPGSILNAADVTAAAAGIGGSAVDGTGGLGQGGIVTTDATGIGAQLFAGSIFMNAGSIGGASSSGTGGDAIGGTSSVTAENSGSITVDTQLVANTVASAGSGATGGDAFGGESAATARDTGTLNIANLDINANANTLATSGGSVEGGIAELFVVGPSSVSANTTVLSAQANGAAGGSATGGSATVEIGTSGVTGTGQLDIGTLVLEVDGLGNGTMAAGDFDIYALNGNATFQTLIGTALGDSAGDSISLEADGFDITINGSATINAFPDIEFITANGGTILGGATIDSLTGTFDFTTSGLISIIGDNDDLPSFGAFNMTLESSDITVLPGARFGAANLNFVSSNTDATAVIGGTTDGLGYTLTQEEAGRIEADQVSFFGPITEDPIAIELRDITIFGTQDEGVSLVSVETPGTMSVVGQIEYIAAAASDQLILQADQTLQIVIPSGGISMTDANDQLSGQLSLQAQTIVAAVSDIVGQVADDPQFAGLADLLSTNDGSLAPEGYVRANSIALVAGENLYIQNTGTADVQGGVLVGDGSLIIGSFSQTTGSTGSGGFTFSGVLMDPNDVLFFDFTVSAASDITLRTYSYAGGTSSTGDVIAAGGFDPILALFDSSGALIDQNDDGFGVPSDPVTGLSYDTLLETNVAAGDYTVSVSVFPNFAGSNINDPFQGATSFGDRTPNYYFEILGVDSASGGVVGATSGPINVFAYGARQGEGGLVTGIDFFNELDFGDPETVSDRFTELSTFNDCLIVGGNCGQVSGPLPTDDPEVIQIVETVTTASISEPPPEVVAQAAEVVEQSEADTEFGVDFPGLFNPPTVQDQSVVREPVTSGGDAASYAENDSDNDDDEEEQDDL